MRTKSIGLAWIPVKNFKEAIKFYTEVVGLELLEINEEWGWAELAGHEGGCRLGIAQYQEGDDNQLETECPVKPGQNAVLSFDVADLDRSVLELKQNGAEVIGKRETIPGHVTMQLIKDKDGNFIHITQMLSPTFSDEEHNGHDHKGGCCGGH